jgi:hypothetical protein
LLAARGCLIWEKLFQQQFKTQPVDGGRVGALGQQSGYFYCGRFRGGGACDVCKHMQREISVVESLYYKRRHAVHRHLVHLKPSLKVKLRWFVYLLEFMLCLKQYISSTTDICSRWSSTKSACNKADSNRTGL